MAAKRYVLNAKRLKTKCRAELVKSIIAKLGDSDTGGLRVVALLIGQFTEEVISERSIQTLPTTDIAGVLDDMVVGMVTTLAEKLAAGQLADAELEDLRAVIFIKKLSPKEELLCSHVYSFWLENFF